MTQIIPEQITPRIIRNAAIIAVIIGILFSAFFLFLDRESYSGLFLYPNSTVFEKQGETVYFVYGVNCHETSRTDYDLNIYSDTNLMINKKFSLNPDEIQEERIKLELPRNTTYPTKIALKMNTGKNMEEVHFWVNG